ncbi:MAG: TadE/TadG family type IV pilus assembly protein [Pseudomonadota bacterium]
MNFTIPQFNCPRWFKSDRGSAAIEFAFIAPMFFALMLGILEIGVMTFAQFAMQNAVTDAGRLIRTGQAQDATALIGSGIAMPQCASDAASTQVMFASPADWFKGQICCGVATLMDCSKLTVTVAAPAAGFNGGFASLGPAGSYSPGTACSVVLVRADYIWTIWFPGLAQLLNANASANFLVNSGSNGRLLSGTTAFRNEPFNSGVAGC